MAKDEKASRKDRKESRRGGSDAGRANAKRLRRLEADLMKATRAEARRRKQLAAAVEDVGQVLQRLQDFASSAEGPAAAAAHELLETTRQQLEASSSDEGSHPQEVPAEGPPAARARRAQPTRSRSTAPRRPRTVRAPARPAAAIAGGTDTPRESSRRRARPMPSSSVVSDAAVETTEAATGGDVAEVSERPDESATQGPPAGEMVGTEAESAEPEQRAEQAVEAAAAGPAEVAEAAEPAEAGEAEAAGPAEVAEAAEIELAEVEPAEVEPAELDEPDGPEAAEEPRPDEDLTAPAADEPEPASAEDVPASAFEAAAPSDGDVASDREIGMPDPAPPADDAAPPAG
jgi:hypothetical protein